MLRTGTWKRSSVQGFLLLTCSLLYGLVQCKSSFYHARYYVTWTEAKTMCESIGGSLLKIEDEAKWLYVYYLIRNYLLGINSIYAWIGLNDLDQEGDFRWPDGTPLTLHNRWAVSMTTPVDTKDCVYWNRYSMTEANCNQNKGFICEVKEESLEGRLKAAMRSCWLANDILRLMADEDTEAVVTCPRNKTYFSPSHVKNPMTWDEADAYCRRANGSLAKVTSAEEQDMVTRIRGRLGLGAAWIGLTGTEGVYSWVDGEPASWPSSYLTSPLPTTNNNCIATTGTTQWEDFECSTRQAFLCERDVASLPMDQACVWRLRDGALWTQHQQTCQDAGGTMVHVKSLRHYARLRGKTRTDTFFGLTADNVTGEFTWTDGSIMTWSYWVTNQQPSGVNGSEPYGGVDRTGRFVDFPATSVSVALCQKDVFQFRNAYIVHGDGSITVRCHKYCAFQDGSRTKTWTCDAISVTSAEEGCLCSKENTWSTLEPWLSHLDPSVLQDEDNTTCLSIDNSIQALTLSNHMLMDADFETDVVLSPDLEHLRGDVARVFTSADMTPVTSTCQLSGGLQRCKHLWGLTYACKCAGACRLYVKVFQPPGPSMKVTICDVDFIL